jgi:hypothetical protein
MFRILVHSAIGLMFLSVGLPTQAQSTGATAGAQMGRGTGPGAGRGAGAGAGRGATMPERGQGRGQNQGDMFTLVGDPAVQNELKLDAQQREKLRTLGESEHARQAAQMLSQRGSCERTDDRRAVMAKVRNDIEEILSQSQWKRLNEIWVQVRGVRALQSERISKTLELTRPQQKQIDQLLSGGFRGRAAQIELQVLELLNENQRQQFVALQGVPFQRESAAGGGPDSVPPRDGRGRMQR